MAFNPFATAPAGDAAAKAATPAAAPAFNPFSPAPATDAPAAAAAPAAATPEPSSTAAAPAAAPAAAAEAPEAFNPFGAAPPRAAPAPIEPKYDFVADVDPNEPSVLKSTDVIQVQLDGEQPHSDVDSLDGASPETIRRRQTAAAAMTGGMRASAAKAARSRIGDVLPNSTLQRSYSLSNKSQLEVMKMVRDGKLTQDEALDWAGKRHADETEVPQLDSSTQLRILSMVKSGMMTQDEAFEEGRKLEAQMNAGKHTSEQESAIEDFYEILGQIVDLQFNFTRERAESFDSLADDLEAAKEIFDDPSLLEDQ